MTQTLSDKQFTASRDRFLRCVMREQELNDDMTLDGALVASVIKRMGWGKPEWPTPAKVLALPQGEIASKLKLRADNEAAIRQVFSDYLAGVFVDPGLDSYVEIRTR